MFSAVNQQLTIRVDLASFVGTSISRVDELSSVTLLEGATSRLIIGPTLSLERVSLDQKVILTFTIAAYLGTCLYF